MLVRLTSRYLAVRLAFLLPFVVVVGKHRDRLAQLVGVLGLGTQSKVCSASTAATWEEHEPEQTVALRPRCCSSSTQPAVEVVEADTAAFGGTRCQLVGSIAAAAFVNARRAMHQTLQS